MPIRIVLGAVLSVAFGWSASVAFAADEKPADPKVAPKVTYDEHIQPIFRAACFTCHNQNEAKSDLALDSYARTMAGGAGGECVIAGDVESSRLYALVAHLETPKMPPNQDKIAEAQLNLIKQWIVGGALENSGSKAKIKPKVSLELATTAGNKPSGPPAMPEKFRRQPFVATSRAGASTAMAASPWAPLVAVAGQKQIMLHNTDTGELLTILAYPEGVPHILKFSRDGSVLLAGGGRGGSSGKVVLYNVKSGERITEVGDELDVVLAADVSSDLSRVALGGPKKMVRVFSVADGSLEYEMKKHTDWVTAIEFSPDGILLATADRSAGLMIWESEGGREYQNLTGHTAAITDVSWRSDSNLLASVSEDGSLRLWEMENGKQVKTWAANAGGSQSVEFSPNGTLVTAGRDKLCKVWNIDGKALATCEAMPDMVLDAVLAYDSKRVIAGDWTGEGRIFDAATGKTVGKLLLNPLPLDQMVIYATQQAAEAEKVAQAAAADAEAAKKGAEAAGAAAQAAVKKAADAAAEVKRLEALRPQLDKDLPVKQAALKAAQQKAGEVRRALTDAKGTESRAALTVKQRTDALATSAAGVKKLEEEIAKLTADKKDAALPAVQKRLENTKAEAAQRTAQIADAAKALADAQAKVKQLTTDSAAADQLVAKANADLEGHRKAIVDAGNALRGLQPQLKPLQEAIAKVNAAKAAADKVAADKAAVAKTAGDAAAGTRQAAQRAAADKAEFDKSNNAQASAAR
ncbi:MAG: hypothetical protein C0483_13150 [Pirellula sp.]|nr:hypothetical protein [Pirellula sp.]